MSETEKLAADPLNSRVEPQWIGLVQAHATDACLSAAVMLGEICQAKI